MKKSIITLGLFTCGMLAALTSCGGKKELKQMRAMVSEMEIHGDTLISLTVSQGEESYLVNLDRAKFNNGMALKGDSVLINYTDGRNDSLRAYFVTVLPKPARLVEDVVHEDQAVLTAPENRQDDKTEDQQ